MKFTKKRQRALARIYLLKAGCNAFDGYTSIDQDNFYEFLGRVFPDDSDGEDASYDAAAKATMAEAEELAARMKKRIESRIRTIAGV